MIYSVPAIQTLIRLCGRASLGMVPSEGEGSQNDAKHILTMAKAAR